MLERFSCRQDVCYPTKSVKNLFVHMPLTLVTRGQSNLTKSASRGPIPRLGVTPRGSKVVPLNSWGRVSY